MAEDIQVITGTDAKIAARLCNFSTGKASLLQSHQIWLDQKLRPIIDSLQNPWVDIIGYASRRGNAAFNLQLSKQRCDSAKQWVARYSDKILFPIQWGKGEAESGPNERSDDGYWRAVEIYVYGSKPAAVDSRAPIEEAIIKAHNIVRRRDWGALTPKYDKLVRDWDYDSIVIHHSGNRGAKDPKEIEKKHMGDNNYDDIGYHYMIHPGGKIYEGREIIYKGSHVRNANTQKIGILMMGDYDHQWWDFDDDDLSQAHLQKLKDLIKTLTKHFLGIKYLGGHLEFAEAQGDERTCPGGLLIAELDGLRKEFALNAPTKP